MSERLTIVLAVALACTACGTTYSSSYGTPLPTNDAAVPSADAVTYDAPTALPEAGLPAPDASDAGHRQGPPYPIILHHGFAGFRQIGSLSYFYDVAQDLTSRGEAVFESQVTPFASSEQRGTELAAYVDQVLAQTNSDKVIVIAHSQGGIDARYMISSLHYGDRVALLATVATPHRGTYLADALLANSSSFSNALLDAVGDVLGVAYGDIGSNADFQAALTSMSQSTMTTFNLANLDDDRVIYWSWAGRSNQRTGDQQCGDARFVNDPTHVDTPNALLAPFADFLEQGNPNLHVNDGLVEVQSARWGYFMGCVPADHFDEVGQIAETGADPQSGFDHLAFYEQVVSLAHAAGL